MGTQRPTLVPKYRRSFTRVLAEHQLQPLYRRTPSTLQVNMGKRCNQACRHCHVNAGPLRTEEMTGETVDRLVWLLQRNPRIKTVDITGGAPELNPHFRRLVRSATAMGRHVMDRCNLTILQAEGQTDTAEFLAQHRVEIVASLPCYGADNVDKQRGPGVFASSIAGLQELNTLGYGQFGSDCILNLVYNPAGPYLPPAQASLEEDYRARLAADFGIVFNHLYTITNMPIERFAQDLQGRETLDAYMELLVQNFNPASVGKLMCKDLISVGWDGKLYDCDFNQMLDMRTPEPFSTVWEVEDVHALHSVPISTGRHCFGCTAGTGSSCGGAIVPTQF